MQSDEATPGGVRTAGRECRTGGATFSHELGGPKKSQHCRDNCARSPRRDGADEGDAPVRIHAALLGRYAMPRARREELPFLPNESACSTPLGAWLFLILDELRHNLRHEGREELALPRHDRVR